MRFLLRDRDGKYSPAFDAVFQSEELDILQTAPQTPRMNAHCERVIQTLRHELRDSVDHQRAHRRRCHMASIMPTGAMPRHWIVMASEVARSFPRR
jgi:hypothetical protein